MSNALVSLSQVASEYARASKARNTIITYQKLWRQFVNWCEKTGAQAMPAKPQDVAAYLAHLATQGKRYSTIATSRAAIAAAHKLAKKTDPTADEIVKMTLSGIARQHGTMPKRKAPITIEEIRKMIKHIGKSCPDKRDKALLLLGFAGAFRRSELVSLDVDDVTFAHDEMRVLVRRSKTDQHGQGTLKVIPRIGGAVCPVDALQQWMECLRRDKGPLFVTSNGRRITPQMVALVVKKYARLANLDYRQYSGHSLRAGYVTSAIVAGASPIDVAQQTGHRNLDTLRAYIRDAGLQAKKATQAAFGKA